jgi:hypothetical protein
VILKAVLTVQRVLPLDRFGALLAYAFAVTSEAMEAIIAGQKSEGEGGSRRKSREAHRQSQQEGRAGPAERDGGSGQRKGGGEGWERE